MVYAPASDGESSEEEDYGTMMMILMMITMMVMMIPIITIIESILSFMVSVALPALANVSCLAKHISIFKGELEHSKLLDDQGHMITHA